MNKILVFFVMLTIALTSCKNKNENCIPSAEVIEYPTDSVLNALNWPEDLVIKGFSGPKITPSPACMAVAASGEVFVGVDMMGSLGKEIGKGFIKRLVDCNHDGIMDYHTEFAQVDNPRGILPIGDQVFVLHTTFSDDTKKADNMDLVVLDDKDKDGIADGPPKVLIKNMSNSKYLRERGTDHATNGIQMGIDGWIYIAVGDFGFYNATDREGSKMTQLGGGIVRIRPDGTDMEVYSHGMRNIYDVAIDPFMNIFTRGNTNDGGGWNVRFTHQIQSGEYGYPILFKHFTEEILPALVDVGGGSGTGSLFMNDDRWPEKYNNVPMMADWGRNQLYIHRVTKDGPSFTQNEKQFIQLPQITDVDVDASGTMYLSAWDGAGYSGNPDKGYVVRVTPEDFTYESFVDVKEVSINDLIDLLKAKNAKSRLSAQYELLQRQESESVVQVLELAKEKNQALEVRAAAIFTYAQLAGAKGIAELVTLSKDASVQRFTLRALADRKEFVKKVPVQPFLTGLKSTSEEVKAAAIIGLGRLGNPSVAQELLQIKVPSSFAAPKINSEGPHATPNAEIIFPHLAVKALVELNAVDDCIAALGTDNEDLALWAMRYMHNPKVVKALIEAYNDSTDEVFKKKAIHTLARIYHKEAPYDTSWWWSTRPDTHGPYYKTMEWEQSPVIRSFLVAQFKARDKSNTPFFAELNSKYRLAIDAFGEVKFDEPKEDMPLVDFEKIKNKKGQIGEASIEDVILSLGKIKGNVQKGAGLFNTQGCVACHSINKDQVLKGPFMGQIGAIMNREQIAESILKPNASISQGFSTVQISTKGGDNYVGFVTAESADRLTIRNIVGDATELKKADIAERNELETSMMPAGLANALSFEEMASLVAFLSQQK
ncbi:putative heme-binding domain-containing protein [Pricia antarctica]|uniref:Putative heme-binding domain-containing protein n=1 Tax=Pricia antarctica TaxID=641691 RepID=A0A1G7A206_9FLAO|nr:c-type cytochrome [Pricia antarctica]SDE08852.1 putative heme-binding domain-containing protein [Pricia antarctica]